jgi:Zn-dependent protease
VSLGLDDRAAVCAGCGSEIAAGRLACPACRRLVHSDELARLAGAAEHATSEGRAAEAVTAWREALALLPPDSAQHRAIGERLAGAVAEAERQGSSQASGVRWRSLGVVGTLALVAWKAKFLLVFALSKAKLLVSGLAKGSTFLSMAASLGVYWAAWGWSFAAGIVGSIYIHEMGHVAALRRLGIPASAPMFVPGLGAFVRMKQLPANPSEEARVGLAGPVWGLFAALACAAVSLATGSAYWGALAVWGARINLFNLIPVRPLDGGRGLLPLSRREAAAVTGVIAATLLLTGEGMLWLLLLVAGGQLLAGGASGAGDRRAAVTYSLLVAALGALCRLPVSIP